MKVLEDKMFGGDELVDFSRIKSRYQPLKEGLKQVEEQIKALDKPSTNLKDSEIEKIINGLRHIGDLCDAMNTLQKKQFLRFFISKAFLEKERIITNFEFVPEFETLVTRDLVRIRANWLPRLDNSLKLMNCLAIADPASQSPTIKRYQKNVHQPAADAHFYGSPGWIRTSGLALNRRPLYR